MKKTTKMKYTLKKIVLDNHGVLKDTPLSEILKKFFVFLLK